LKGEWGFLWEKYYFKNGKGSISVDFLEKIWHNFIACARRCCITDRLEGHNRRDFSPYYSLLFVPLSSLFNGDFPFNWEMNKALSKFQEI
jgi:hypothetical protein